MTRQVSSHPPAVLVAASLALAGLLASACGRRMPVPQMPVTPQEGGPPTGTSVPEPESQAAAGEQPLPTPQALYTPGSIILDSSQTVSLEGGPVELSFDSPARQVIRVDVNAIGGALRYELQLLDKFNNALAHLESRSAEASESIAEFALPYQGAYRIILMPLEGAGTRQIVVTALDAPSGGGTQAALSSWATAAVMAGHVYHTYAFPLAEGQVVTLAARAATPGQPDTHLDLYGPDGRLLAQADDALPGEDLDAVLAGFVAPLGGEYVAIITNLADTRGEYRFAVTPDDVPPPAEGEADLVYDREYRAAFYEGSLLNLTFDGTVGDPLRIEVYAPDPSVDVDLRLYSPFGQVIAYALDNGSGEGERISEMQLPYTGQYRLEFTPYGSGEASFRLEQLDPSTLTGGGVFGDELAATRTGRLEAPGTFHYFQFNAEAGDRITLVAQSESSVGLLDLGFAVLGPDGRQMVFADDSTSENPSDPELRGYEVSLTGTYTVVVYSFNDAQGTYELRYERQN